MRVSMRGLRRLNQRHREITRKNVSGLSYVSQYPILVSSRERIRSGSECLGRLGNIGERERERRERVILETNTLKHPIDVFRILV